MTDQRELVFVVADMTMQQTLLGFFGRPQFHRSLRCGAFPIDARLNRDVFVAAGQNDPGLYARGRAAPAASRDPPPRCHHAR
ncbi:MAG: hypothetical protein ACRDSN_16200, partial [Pseudonocardiaceae bacterium]